MPTDRGNRVASTLAGATDAATSSTTGRTLVRVGLATYGVMHLLVAWIALQLAWGTGGGEASQQGAFAKLASEPFGLVMLWVAVVGLVALALWQIAEAISGHREVSEQGKRVRKRLGSAGRAVVYAALAVSALTTAIGARSGSSNSKEKTFTATLLSAPAGRILVVAVAVVILVIAGRHIWRGVKKKFTKDLAGTPSTLTVRLGQIGFVAKGVALGIVGVLFGLAGITHDPNKAGGIDQALRTLLDQPFGPILLTAVALGIACFGAYCFAWARNPKT